MPGKTKPTVDPSGHVTFTSQQMSFYSHAQHRAECIEAARNAGTLEYKPTRNPLRAEKTPRPSEYKCFNFSVPDGPKDLKAWNRWDYPTIDFGLMGKFSSQKHIYDTYMGKHIDYKSKLAEFRKDHGGGGPEGPSPAGLWSDESSDATARPPSYDAFEGENKGRISPPKLHLPGQTSRDAGHNTGRDTARDSLDPRNVAKISDFRMVSSLNPDAIAKWRAKRAADFVTTQKHPLDPPTARELPERPFVVTILKTGHNPHAPVTKEKLRKIQPPVNKFATAPVVDTARLTQSLGSLMTELQRTDDEISRHELKLALKSKTKAY